MVCWAIFFVDELFRYRRLFSKTDAKILKRKLFCSSETATELKIFGQHASQLYETLHNTTASDLINPQVEELKDRLYKITNEVCNLTTKNDEIDQLGDLVEKELSGMDSAIEEVSLDWLHHQCMLNFLSCRLLKKSSTWWLKPKLLIRGSN